MQIIHKLICCLLIDLIEWLTDYIDFSWESNLHNEKWMKEHINLPRNNVEGPMWQMFSLVNSKNTHNMYPLTLSWPLVGHTAIYLKQVICFRCIVTMIVSTGELLSPATTLL